jgi:hypothetical protein
VPKDKFELKLLKVSKALRVPADARRLPKIPPARPTIDAGQIYKSLKASAGSDAVLKQVPNLAKFALWLPVATFSVCLKTGTAMFLDIWDSDHFDGFTDMQRCLTDCRAWFSANGFTFWDSAQTKTGRINCFFNAPSDGTYICNAELQSFGGPAMVECVIDSSSFGPLPFNGSITQPHTCSLVAGGHSFRIRQLSGSFFFIGLSVWKV